MQPGHALKAALTAFAVVACVATTAQTPTDASMMPGHAMPSAPAPAPRPLTWGEHGMVLFGGADGLFASHLPMFHAPHDYHVVIAVKIESSSVDAALRERLAMAPQLWTLVPEEFELARLAPGAKNPLTKFEADIVEGHFERGGKTIYSGVVVDVIRTERYARVDPAAKHATTVEYQPVGRGRTWFLVKEVHARPDFDHVVMLSSTNAPHAIKLQVSGIAGPSDAAIQSLLDSKTHVVGTVYYDTEDLQ